LKVPFNGDIETAADASQIIVDLSIDTGAVTHGAAGFLYGLGAEGVPDVNMLIPLQPQVAAQKAPDGMQHPSGDALQVAETFLQVGGSSIQVYMQDIYREWIYPDVGIEDYLLKVEAIVSKIMDSPYRKICVYVPFNEPDWIWYNTTDKKQKFLQHWKIVHRKIRSMDPFGPIAGPALGEYDAAFYEDFFLFCVENDCLPDITVWHELKSDFFTKWDRDFHHYRNLEKVLGFAPRTVSINEYGRHYDVSNPGTLVQFISKFETSKVVACLAFWHTPGSLNTMVVDNNQPNGAWWLYKWYGDMTGSTVQVTPPQPNRMGLQGVASYDRVKQQIRFLFGGIDGTGEVVVKGFDSNLPDGDFAHVTVWSTSWTGQQGIADEPLIQMEGDYSIVNGRIVVPVQNMDSMSAYHMIISPGTGKSTPFESKVWKKRAGADQALLEQAVMVERGSNDNSHLNTTSTGYVVGALDSEDSRAVFLVDVPCAGNYLLNVYYSACDTSRQALRVDQRPWQIIDYHPTTNWDFIGRKELELELDAGVHTFIFKKNGGTMGSDKGSVMLDSIELRCSPQVDPLSTKYPRRYEAEYARLSEAARVGRQYSGYAGTGYVEGYGDARGAGASFVVQVNHYGFYQVRLRYSAGPRPDAPENRQIMLCVNGSKVKDMHLSGTASWHRWQDASIFVFLQAGVNLIDLKAAPDKHNHAVCLDFIEVQPVPGDVGKLDVYEAEALMNELGGTAARADNAHASGNNVVTGIGNGVGNFLQFNGIHAERSGQYKMIIHFANNDRWEEYSYSQLVFRHADVWVNGEFAKRVHFCCTFGWSCFRTIVADVHLNRGANRIRLCNASGPAPHIDKIEISPVYLESLL